MLKWAYLDWLAQSPYTTSVLQRLALHDRPTVVKDYRYHDFPNTEFSYFLTIDTR